MMTDPTPSETEQLRRRNHELSVLNTIAQALSRSVELDEVLQVTLAHVAKLLGLRTGWVWLLREGDGRSYLAAALNLPPGLANFPQRMEGWCYCLETFRDGDLHGAANINIITCTRLKSLVDGTDGLRYHASIPLYAPEKKQLGVLNVASPDWREPSPAELRLLHTIGDLLSIAIERARLFARSAQFGAVAERNRLAREIHDTLAQGLTGIALQLESADALLDSGAAPDQVRATVQRALDLTRANLEEARRSVLDLRGAMLAGRSLAQALRALIQDSATSDGPTLHFSVVGANVPLPQRIEVALLRIVQEALTNVLRHAHATTVHVRLVVTPQQVRCTIRDDGQGFDPTQAPSERFGLIGINERVKLLGGTIALATGPNRGTRLDVQIPLEARP